MHSGVYIIHFRIKVNQEFLSYGFPHFRCEVGHVTRCGISPVYYHERLLIVNLRPTASHTFHSGMIYQPCRRDLRMHRVYRMASDHLSCQRSYLGQLPVMHNRIFEETACASYKGRIRKLAVADTTHFFGDFPDRRHVSESLLKFTQRAIFQICRLQGGTKTERYPQHYITAFAFMLEEAVAIPEPALLRRKAACFTRKHVKAFDSMDNIFRLHTIRTDILHRGGSNFAGNTGKILDTTESLVKSPIHEIRPFLARTDNSEDRIFIFVITPDPLDC